MPSETLRIKTPFKLLYDRQPDLSFFKAFGCLSFITASTVGRETFTSKAHPCVLIGYPVGQKLTKF